MPCCRFASSLKLNAVLLLDLADGDNPQVVKCSVSWICSPFISCPSTRTSWTPTTITVDDANDVVFVGDSKNAEIHAFDFAGNVVHSIDTPFVTSSLAFRPGLFAPLSETSLVTANITTTSPIVFTATSFHDRFGEPVVGIVDFTTFAIKATGEIGVGTTATIEGGVTLGGAGVEFKIEVKYAGQWTFSLVDVFNEECVVSRPNPCNHKHTLTLLTRYEEHLGSSPYTINVSEGGRARHERNMKILLR